MLVRACVYVRVRVPSRVSPRARSRGPPPAAPVLPILTRVVSPCAALLTGGVVVEQRIALSLTELRRAHVLRLADFAA